MPRHALLADDWETASPNAYAMFGEFAAVVAHDVGAPLRSIAGFSQLLEERCRPLLDEKSLHYIDVIQENSRKAQARLAALLQYAQVGATPLKVEAIDSRHAAEHALAQLQEYIEAREALVRINPLPLVAADRGQLELLFYILIDNALKFCSARPEITIAAQRGYEAWVFSVRDNGIGIASEHHRAVFELFRRLHGEDAYSGTGVGLAIAEHIARLHGGMIWVESGEGQGSAFFFTLPDKTQQDEGLT